MGKTITSLSISYKYFKHRLLIGVPSNYLIGQWVQTICSFYTNVPILVISGEKIEGVRITTTTKRSTIEEWTRWNSIGIIITTYTSSHHR